MQRVGRLLALLRAVPQLAVVRDQRGISKGLQKLGQGHPLRIEKIAAAADHAAPPDFPGSFVRHRVFLVF